MVQKSIYTFFIFGVLVAACQSKKTAIVLQTDFGLKDGAVSAMKGVILNVDREIPLFDLTHEIPAYNIWEAAYRLEQTYRYWPAGTIFVSVVDPGVGTNRRSIVMKTKTGHYFVTPDNGTLTLVAESAGIERIQEIDEHLNRRPGSSDSYTFHGRDVYAYTAGRLASGVIGPEKIGPLLNNDSLVKIPYQKPFVDKDTIWGMIPILDSQYGNVWTNIPDSFLRKQSIKPGDSIRIVLYNKDSTVHSGTYLYAKTFGAVSVGKSLVYLNSLLNFSIASNERNFADSFHIKSGPDWTISIIKK